MIPVHAQLMPLQMTARINVVSVMDHLQQQPVQMAVVMQHLEMVWIVLVYAVHPLLLMVGQPMEPLPVLTVQFTSNIMETQMEMNLGGFLKVGIVQIPQLYQPVPMGMPGSPPKQISMTTVNVPLIAILIMPAVIPSPAMMIAVFVPMMLPVLHLPPETTTDYVQITALRMLAMMLQM